MKTKSLVTIILLLATGVSFAQEGIFKKFSEQKNITCITITKTLLNMLPDVSSSVEMNGMNIKDITANLEQIDIFTSQDNSARLMMKKETAQHFKNDKSYEVLMKIKDEESNIIFYGQKNDNFFKSLVMLIDEDDEYVLIRLSGKFTTEDIRMLTKK
jgi:hypothetical protein